MDSEVLLAKRESYMTEMKQAEMVMLRLQGAIAAIDELLRDEEAEPLVALHEVEG